jgi:putative thioredoxin
MFRVQGIPMVYAVVGGQRWTRSPGRAGGAVASVAGGPAARGRVGGAGAEDPDLLAADDLLADGDLDGAERAYKKILADRPAEAAAESGLAQWGSPSGAGRQPGERCWPPPRPPRTMWRRRPSPRTSR